MPVVRLDSLSDSAVLQDPLIADYRGVRDPDRLADQGLFVAEGRLVVRRLLEQTRYPVRSVLLNDAAFNALSQMLPAFPPAQLPVFVAPTAAFANLAGVHIHRGCLAVGVRQPLPEAAALVRSTSLVVVLEGVGNADNVGGIFRNAAAFGAGAVLLDEATVDPLYRKAIRTSAAASLTVPFTRLTPWPDALDRLGAEGFQIAAFTPRAGALSLEQLAAEERQGPLALLFGSEGDGLSVGALVRAHRQVRIPMAPGTDSLNIAVAAGIALSRLSPVARSG